MHPGLLKEIVQLCRRRQAAGDHPTEPVADAEVLENAIVQMAAEAEVLAGWMADVLPTLEVSDAVIESEDGGEHSRMLIERGKKLVEYVLARPNTGVDRASGSGRTQSSTA